MSITIRAPAPYPCGRWPEIARLARVERRMVRGSRSGGGLSPCRHVFGTYSSLHAGQTQTACCLPTYLGR